MGRVAGSMGVLALVVGMAISTAPAVAGGCEVLTVPGDRAECVARREATAAARAEVADRTSARSSSSPGAGRSAAWQDAIDEANGPHVDELVNARLIAAVGGLVWFWLAWRHQRRRNRRQRA